MSARLDAFVVCTPGLEPIVAAEIERLGVRSPRVRHGGVDASVTLAQLWSLNLRLRSATRVLVRIARFKADSFVNLQLALRKIDWAEWLPADRPVELRVASSSSALYHTGAIAERVAEIVPNVVGPAGPAGPPGSVGSIGSSSSVGSAGFGGDDDGHADHQVLHVRVTSDIVLISLDSSGEALYRRGWRLDTAKAPMRETLAAALVLHSGWDRKAPLIDPFCGSGTIAIEAALMASRVAAGRQRSFAFERWPNFDAAGWERLRAGAAADVVPCKAPIVASDRDEGAIVAARANAARAGVADAVSFEVAPVSKLSLPPRPGWLVTNPPYGHRIAEKGSSDLRDLYDRLGGVLREHGRGWKVEIVGASGEDGRPARLVDRLPLTVDARVSTSNGGIPIEFVRGAVAG